MVQVGSFHGKSAIIQAMVLDQNGYSETPLLCIDSWTGKLDMLLFRSERHKDFGLEGFIEGRSASSWQFMLNVQFQIVQEKVGSQHIVPLTATSVVGARFLFALGLTPDIVYLDSSHEADETFTELTLYYHVLASGGVIFGDNFSWDGVQHDVLRFAAKKGIGVKASGQAWMLQKPHR